MNVYPEVDLIEDTFTMILSNKNDTPKVEVKDGVTITSYFKLKYKGKLTSIENYNATMYAVTGSIDKKIIWGSGSKLKDIEKYYIKQNFCTLFMTIKSGY